MASNYNNRKILTKLLVLKFLGVLALLLICHPTITSSVACTSAGDGQFKCVTVQQCIPIYYKCDHTDDCADNSDETSCTAADLQPFQDNFLLAVDNGGFSEGLYQINVSSGLVKQLLASRPANPAAVAFDPATRNIYWTDVQLKLINKYSLTTQIVTQIYTDVNHTASYEGLTLDSGRQMLYFTNSVNSPTSYGQLCEISMNGSNFRIIYNQLNSILIAIVVDTQESVLYWTDIGTSSVGIYKMSIADGSQPIPVITSKLTQPKALAIDFSQKVMYWADAGTHAIEMANLDGTDRMVIYQSSSAQYYGMTLSPTIIYVTDWLASGVTQVNRSSHGVTQPVQYFTRLNGIVYYSSANSTPVDDNGLRVSSTTAMATTINANSDKSIGDTGLPTNTIITVAVVIGGVFLIVTVLTIGAILIVRRNQRAHTNKELIRPVSTRSSTDSGDTHVQHIEPYAITIEPHPPPPPPRPGDQQPASPDGIYLHTRAPSDGTYLLMRASSTGTYLHRPAPQTGAYFHPPAPPLTQYTV